MDKVTSCVMIAAHHPLLWSTCESKSYGLCNSLTDVGSGDYDCGIVLREGQMSIQELKDALAKERDTHKQDEIKEQLHIALAPQVGAMVGEPIYCGREDHTELKPSFDGWHACTACGINYNTNPNEIGNYYEYIALNGYKSARRPLGMDPGVTRGDGYVIIDGVRYDMTPEPDPEPNADDMLIDALPVVGRGVRRGGA